MLVQETGTRQGGRGEKEPVAVNLTKERQAAQTFGIRGEIVSELV
jgi:hypothetical protein